MKIFDQFVPRTTAARMLKISARTLDRVAKKGQIRAHKRRGRVYFSLGEIQELAQKYTGSPLAKVASTAFLEKGRQEEKLETQEARNSEDDKLTELTRTWQQDWQKLLAKQEEFQNEILKSLQNDLHNAQQRLEAANYRVGQLEADLRNSVPLLESLAKSEEISGLRVEVDQLRSGLREAGMEKLWYGGLVAVATAVAVGTLLFW